MCGSGHPPCSGTGRGGVPINETPPGEHDCALNKMVPAQQPSGQGVNQQSDQHFEQALLKFTYCLGRHHHLNNTITELQQNQKTTWEFYEKAVSDS